jgi:ElaB/YqjD/DUF883 family membrane-anchored ribosome-binding protein
MESKSSTTASQKHNERVSDGAHRAVDTAADRANALADRFGERADELMEMKEDWVEAARGYVREHPVASLGIAVAAGYLLSAILRGGRD